MRKLLYILPFLVLFSCEKENDVSMDFKITGVNNASVVRGETLAMPMQVYYLGGEPEEVTVSVSGLPPGITVVLENATGEPDFSLNAVFTVDASFTPTTVPVTVVVTSESNKQITKTFQLTVKDPANKLPVIVLAGSPILTWTLNDPYTEFGYMATDAEDGDLTSQVVVQGTVKHDTVGVYIIKYYVTDSDGEMDSASRTVTVLNSLSYMQGMYSCITEIQGGPTFAWQADIAASPYNNNNFVLSKISDCYGTFADPLRIELVTNGPNITIPPQIEYGLNSNFPSHCEEAFHSISGTGTIDFQFPYTFILNYTDLYEDANGLQHTFIKKDTYVKVL